MLMKKFFTLFAAAVTALSSVGAALPVKSSGVAHEFKQAKEMKLAKKAPQSMKTVTIPEVSYDDADFVDAGEIRYVDDIFTYAVSWYEDEEIVPLEWKVKVEKSISTEGLWRVVDPFKDCQYVSDYPDTFKYVESETPRYWYFHVYDDGRADMDAFDSGVYLVESDTEYTIMSQAGYYLASGSDESGLLDEDYGYTRYGVVNFYEMGIVLLNNGLGFWANENAGFRLFLPGSKDFDVAYLSSTTCADTEYTCTLTVGAQSDNVVGCFVPGDWFDYDDGVPQFLVANGKKINIEPGTTSTVTFGFSDPAPEKGEYTHLVGVLDDEGELVKMVVRHFWVVPQNEEGWEKIGTASFTDVLVPNLAFWLDAEEITCDLEQSISNKGLYRLVNPYAGTAYAQDEDCVFADDHNHYITIDATDPEKVVLLSGPVGLDFGFGESVMSGYAHILQTWGLEDDAIAEAGCFGTHDPVAGTFTIPAGCLLGAEVNYDSGEWGKVNSEDFVITYTVGSAVGSLPAADASARYFNLQGMPVSADAKGVKIKVSGRNAVKVAK